MDTNTEHRKLAAIMFTDMVGYSALAQSNEALALELLAENQRVLRTQFVRFNGREVKTTGDGFLVEFPSALHATQCAVEIQRAIVALNSTQPGKRHMQVRIGIHVGDVVHREADMYGDGVNIAARIEPLAVGGGICLSDTVYSQVRNKLEAGLGLTKLDAPKLKHIEVPMDVYRLVLPWESGQAAVPARSAVPSPLDLSNRSHIRLVAIIGGLLVGGMALWQEYRRENKSSPGPSAPATATNNLPAASPVATIVTNQKSIAVLPFANMSEEKDNAFFADGIHEDLLTMLSLVHDLHVVSRTSMAQYRNTTKSMRQIAQELGVAYVLEGSVRRAGNKVRVTGQLIRAASDEHVWAKSYDRDLTDIFAIQSELAKEIAGALSAVLSPQEKSLIERRPTDNPAAYDLYLKGRSVLKGMRSDLNRAQAEQFLEEAVKLDPNFAAAWGMLSLAHVTAVFGDEDHSPERLAKAKAAIETAVSLAPGDPEVIEMQGSYYYYGYRDYARAAEQYQRLLLLRPNSAEAYAQLGFMLRRQARWTEALANLRHALELDPRNINVANGLTDLLLALRQYDEAIAMSRHAAELANGDFLLQAFQFQILFVAHGAAPEMKAWMENLKGVSPNDPRMILLRAAYLRGQGDWPAVVKLDAEQPYPNPFAPHWSQDVVRVVDLLGANDLVLARAEAGKLVPQIKTLLDQQPDNATMWGSLAFLHALRGDVQPARECAKKSKELLPESVDAVGGPATSLTFAQVLALTGDKDGALAELTRLLHTPYGANVNITKLDPTWRPLRDDPRFQALLNDPTNNAPLVIEPTNSVPLP